MLTVEEALCILQQEGMTESIQMLRRWLREGKIKGIASSRRKEGWRIPEHELHAFIATRIPDTTNFQQHIARLSQEIQRLTLENERLQQLLRDAGSPDGATRHVAEGPKIELALQEVESLWRETTKNMAESAEILGQVHHCLFRNLFHQNPSQTMLYDARYKQPYLCPFSNKKFKSAENLVKSAIPRLIDSTKNDIKRRQEKEERQPFIQKMNALSGTLS